jgi:hypothetical protein
VGLLNPPEGVRIVLAWFITMCLVLCSTWFKHDDPTPIAMDGNKMKLNFDVTHGMLYNGLAACLRMFDEKEKDMMANVHGDPVWRST